MSCSKEMRVRVTDRNTPDLVCNTVTTDYDVTPPSIGYATFYRPMSSYHKSITDSHCVYTQSEDPDDDYVDPKVGCEDCVKQSRSNFNMVRSESYDFQEKYEIALETAHSKINGALWTMANNAVAGSDGFLIAVSHAQLGTTNPSTQELSDALRAITPDVDTFFPTLNIYETLFELKELSKLLDLFRVNVRDAPLDTFSGHYLGFNFGYVPLVSTIRDVIDILLKLDGVIDKWNDFATADRIMDFHGTLRKSETFDEFNVDTLSTGEHMDSIEYQYKLASEDNHKVHLYIKPEIIPGDMRFRVLLKALGIDKPLAGFWELVPFSWLIDYFVNVDDMIGRWETGLNSMFQFTVVDVGYSMYRKTYVETRRINHRHLGSNISSPWNSTESRYFERIPLPASALRDAIIPTEWGWEDGPGGQQWTYVLAVANNIRR